MFSLLYFISSLNVVCVFLFDLIFNFLNIYNICPKEFCVQHIFVYEWYHIMLLIMYFLLIIKINYEQYYLKTVMNLILTLIGFVLLIFKNYNDFSYIIELYEDTEINFDYMDYIIIFYEIMKICSIFIIIKNKMINILLNK